MAQKILYILPFMNLGGTEVHTVELIKGIRSEYEVLVAGPEGKGLSLLEENKIPYTNLPGLTPFDIRLYRSILKSILRDYKPDLIHIQGRYEPAFFSKKILSSTPVIITCHGYGNSIALWDYKLTAITGNNWADKVIAVCNNDKELLIRLGLKPKKVTLIYNGVSTIEDRKSLPQFEGLKIGTVASLIKRKGINYLIEAIDLIVKRFKDIGLFIIGEGEEREKLESLVERLKIKRYIFFLGGLPFARSYINNFDIFVLPSLFESLPVSIIEAYAEKKPVVASNVGGIPELVIDEETGILVPPKDSKALAYAIERLIKDEKLRKKLAENGYNRFIKEFTFKVMVERTQAVYRDILK
ncbi:MAG: glycosyltransferase family 4 protein [bacterium]|nr:glycosyltransferase family 4 protein [bacterium]